MAYYGDFKDLPKRAAADKVLHDKAFNIAKNSKYDVYQCGLTSIGYLLLVYRFFDEKSSGSGVKSENMSKQELAEELNKPITTKFENEKYIHLL